MAISKAQQAAFTNEVRALMTRPPEELKTSAHTIYVAIGRYMAVTQDYVGQVVGRYDSQYRQYENMKQWIQQGDEATDVAAQKRNYAMAIVVGRKIQGRSEAQRQEGALGPSLAYAADQVADMVKPDKPGDGWPAWQVAAATAGIGALVGVGVWLGVKAAK